MSLQTTESQKAPTTLQAYIILSKVFGDDDAKIILQYIENKRAKEITEKDRVLQVNGEINTNLAKAQTEVTKWKYLAIGIFICLMLAIVGLYFKK